MDIDKDIKELQDLIDEIHEKQVKKEVEKEEAEKEEGETEKEKYDRSMKGI